MTYNTFVAVELGKAESMVETLPIGDNREVEGAKTFSPYPSYAELGDAENLVETLPIGDNREVEGAKTMSPYPSYAELGDAENLVEFIPYPHSVEVDLTPGLDSAFYSEISDE